MTQVVSNRAGRISPSPTMAITAEAEALRRQGRDILSLSAGEPDFDTPPQVREAAKRAIDGGLTHYTPVDGTHTLKAAVAAKFQRDNGLDFRPEEILVANGAKQICYNLCQAALDEGDEAVIPAPYWVSYPEMVKLAGGVPVPLFCGPGEGFKLSPERLRAALTRRSRLLFLNSPGNPTGAVYSADELRSLGDVVAEFPRVIVACDDIYEKIHWAPQQFATLAAVCPDLRDRVVTINGVSKGYAMTGWRIGYCGGPPAMVTAMRSIQSHSTSNPCSISQAAAEAALQGDQSFVEAMRETFHRRHDEVMRRLSIIDGLRLTPAQGAFYAFPDCRALMASRGTDSDLALAAELLEAAGVAVVPGSAFGAPGFLRLSYACADDILHEALDRLVETLR